MTMKDKQLNTVSGKILIKETGSGLPGLVISLLYLDSRVNFNVERLAPDNVDLLEKGISLGSDISDSDGSFCIEYAQEDIGEDNQDKGIRFFLIVFSPDLPDKPIGEEILHVSSRIRSKIGRTEKFLIQIPIERARATGVSVWEPGISPDLVSSEIVREIGNRTKAMHDVEKGIRGIVGERHKSERDKRQTKLKEAKRFIREKAVRRFKMPDGTMADNYVSEGQTVIEVNKRVIKRGLDTISRSPIRSILALDKNNLAKVLREDGNIREDLSDEEVENLIFGEYNGSRQPSFFSRDEIEAACRNRTKPYDKCDETAGPPESTLEPEEEPGSTSNLTQATMEEFKKNLSLVLETVTENSLSPHKYTQTRPTSDQIHGYVHGLKLKPGPADVPAYFDFETLNIAFDHVWKQVFDDRLIADIADVIYALEELGGDPEGLVDDETDLLDAAKLEAKRLAEVYSKFDKRQPTEFDTAYFWNNPLDSLVNIAEDIVSGIVDTIDGISGDGSGDSTGKDTDILDRASEKVPAKRASRYKLLETFMKKLEKLQNRDYEFTAFGTDGGERAINYGVLTTYRQRWVPLGYQAGELVKTIPLAPKQTQQFKSRRVVKRSHLEKRSEASESKYNTESQDTLRDISKIVHEAKSKSSYTIHSEAGMDIPVIGDTSIDMKFQKDFDRLSRRTKETFREAVKKSSQEFKQNTRMEVTASEEEQLEYEESGEISNPNDELAMTCLFYELERRYRVSEKIHKVMSVILVAQEIPKPSEINDEWIVSHDWILRRVLLDESFLEALDYVSSADHIAEKTVAQDLESNMVKQQKLVGSLEKQRHDLRYGDALPEPRSMFQRLLVQAYDRKYPGPDGWRNDPDKIRAVYGDTVAEQFVERGRREEEVEQRLTREASLLDEATKAFHDAYRKYANKMIQVHRLRLHIKENIIYYMQTIWDHENPHERIMRLQNTLVPEIKGKRRYSIKKSNKPRQAFTFESPLEYTASLDNVEIEEGSRKLIEIADLGNPLGYMGNYMIFPLVESNDLTTFMMAPYVDERSGVKDPDDFGNYTLSDLDKYVCCLKKNMDPEGFDNIKPYIDEIYEAHLSDPRPDEEEIVVPMESLFIEILPGSYPVLENFKLEHRAVDVQKAVAEVVKQQLENLRYTGRLIKEEFSDPEVDKRVEVKGDAETVISIDENTDN